MDRAGMIHRINQNQIQLDACFEEKRKLEQQISQVQLLANKLKNLNEDFEARQRRRRHALGFFSGKMTLNSIREYYNGMNNLLNGAEYQNARNSIRNAEHVTEQKKAELDRALDLVMERIRELRRNLDFWARELANYKDPEE